MSVPKPTVSALPNIQYCCRLRTSLEFRTLPQPLLLQNSALVLAPQRTWICHVDRAPGPFTSQGPLRHSRQSSYMLAHAVPLGGALALSLVGLSSPARGFLCCVENCFSHPVSVLVKAPFLFPRPGAQKRPWLSIGMQSCLLFLQQEVGNAPTAAPCGGIMQEQKALGSFLGGGC